jgi:hypothetical protein
MYEQVSRDAPTNLRRGEADALAGIHDQEHLLHSVTSSYIVSHHILRVTSSYKHDQEHLLTTNSQMSVP